MPCHYGKNCLLFLFFCIYIDIRIFAFFVLVYQPVNFLKLLISIFTCFHCDSFLHFSLYKTMLLQKLLYHMWRYICLLYTSDAADDLLCVDLGGRRIIKKKK